MLNLPGSVRIFLCTEPADMRRSFDGLAQMVTQSIGQDPLSGHLFVFRNKRADRVKLLYWDRDGLALWYKRLEQGTFSWLTAKADASGLEISRSQLALLLEGVDMSSVKMKKRYVHPQQSLPYR